MPRSENSSHGESSFGIRTRECFCGKKADVRTCWKVPDAGRRFYGCPEWPGGCGLFDWAEEELCKRSQAVVRGLLNKCNLFEQKIASIEQTEQGKQCLENENCTLKKEMKKLEMGKARDKKEILALRRQLKIMYVLLGVCILVLGWTWKTGATNGHLTYKQLM